MAELLARIIGFDAEGGPIWRAAGGRGSIDFAVDDRDDDEPDDFDEEDDEDVDDEDEEDLGDDEDDEVDDELPPQMRGKQQKPQKRPTKQRDTEDDEDGEFISRERMEKIEASLRKNNAENQRNRHVKKILDRLNIKDADEFVNFMIDRGLDPDSGEPLTGDRPPRGDDDRGDDDIDLFVEDKKDGRTREQLIADRRKAEERGTSRAEARWKPAVVQFAAASALSEAGFASKKVGLALRLLDMDEIDVELDNDGQPVVYGLDEQVAKLKEEFPDLFRKARAADDEDSGDERRPRRRTGGRTVNGARAIDGGDRGKTRQRPLRWEDRLLKQMTGGR